MRDLSLGEKTCLKDGVNGTFWHLRRELLEAAIHKESLQQLQCDPKDTLMIARYKYRREAMEEIVRAPYELGK